MAKKKELTLEERIEQALVPQEEWPYELPEGWKWIKLINGFSECLDKFRKPINSKERSQRLGEIPYYGATGQVGWIDDYLLDEDVVLVGEDGAPFFDFHKDKAYLISGKSWVNNHAHIIKSYLGIIGNKYIMYYLNQFNYHGYVNGTTRLKLTQAKLREIKIPLPPIDQIEMLVEQIDTQFEKLDRAKELIQNAIDSFEDRKAAILHKAFTGELTKKWREENGIGLDSWEETLIGNVCKVNPKKINIKDYNDELKVTFIPMKAVSDITARIEEPEERLFKQVKKGYTNFKNDDIIFAKITPCMENGKVAIVHDLRNEIGFGSTEFYVIRPSKKVLKEFIYYRVLSKEFRDEAKGVMTGAVGQQRVPKSFIEDYIIKLPSLAEQREIISIINNLIEKESNIGNIEEVVTSIESIKKSILVKAFRGLYNLG